MHKIWLHLWRMYLRMGLFFYYRRVIVSGIKDLPKNKPIMLLGNHRNALIDPLLIACYCNGFVHFLTRAGVFKNEKVAKFLKSLQMMPVYRVRDGWANLNNNKAIFDKCSELLKANERVALFPEGGHNIIRRVRPLSKGFTRIVFDTLEKYPDMDLQLVPLGVNYQSTTDCPDNASLIYGKAIPAKQFIQEDRNKAVVDLRKSMQQEIAKLTVDIPRENYDAKQQELDYINVDYLKYEEINSCLQNNSDDYPIFKVSSVKWINTFFKYLLILNLIPPYYVWKKIVVPKIIDPEFIASFRFGIAITLVPFYLILVCVVLSLVFTPQIALMYLVFVLVTCLLAIKL